MKYIYLLIILLASLLFVKWVHADYTLPRCQIIKTGARYIPTRIYKTTTGYSCYVNVSGTVKSMGATTLEEATGIYNGTQMTYEGDELQVLDPDGNIVILTVKKMNDSFWGAGFWLMDDGKGMGFSLYNDYARTLLANSVIR